MDHPEPGRAVEDMRRISPSGSCYIQADGMTYYSLFPSFDELCALYGHPEGEHFFEYRDLFRHYRLLYAREHGISCYDVTDERQDGSRRF